MVVATSQATPEKKLSTVTIKSDPKTLQEFEKIVRNAAKEGAIRVRFSSGEWNWYCPGHDKLPKKEKFSKWSSKAKKIDHDLVRWLNANKVKGVQIFIASDADLKTYFDIERILRKHKVVYWIVSPEPKKNRGQGVYLYETDGIARVVEKKLP